MTQLSRTLTGKVVGRKGPNLDVLAHGKLEEGVVRGGNELVGLGSQAPLLEKVGGWSCRVSMIRIELYRALLSAEASSFSLRLPNPLDLLVDWLI
jgi:hypothetical protein